MGRIVSAAIALFGVFFGLIKAGFIMRFGSIKDLAADFCRLS